MLLLEILNFLSFLHSGQGQVFKTKVWAKDQETYTFPEMKYTDIMEKKNVGISFSGGGDRAYISAIGFLAGLNELGFIGTHIFKLKFFYSCILQVH